MKLVGFKFVIVPAPNGTPMLGPAVLSEGKRIGQLVVELDRTNPWLTLGRSDADQFIAEDRTNES